jgi:hypothetical protein
MSVSWLAMLIAAFTGLGVSRRRATGATHLVAVLIIVVLVGYQAMKLHMFA